MSIHRKPKDRSGNTRWEVVIRYGPPGQRKRKAYIVRGTKKEAKAFEIRMTMELETSTPKPEPPVVPRFADFCANQYRRNAELHLKSTTWVKRSSQLAFLMEFFGDDKLSDIDSARIDAYKAKRRKRDKLKKISVNNELRVLRRVLNFARDNCRIPLVPVKIEFFSEKKKRVKLWTEEEIQRLFTACAQVSPDLLPTLVFLANTGCRRGEALALIWNHIDLKRRLVQIWPIEDDDHDGDEWEPKNGKPREVPISDVLMPWLIYERQSPTWVFPCPSTGERYAFWPERKFQRAQKAAGLRGGVHTLRHSFASHFLRETPDLYLLAEILGHSQTRVTELYSHLLPDHLERGRNAVSFSPSIGPAAVAAQRKWRTTDVISLSETTPESTHNTKGDHKPTITESTAVEGFDGIANK